MYKVELWHCRECWQNGDRCGEDVKEDSNVFGTRKAAKEWIENRVRGRKNVKREYHRGDTPSYVFYKTGYTWFHENTGEEWEESYTYTLTKVTNGKRN